MVIVALLVAALLGFASDVWGQGGGVYVCHGANCPSVLNGISLDNASFGGYAAGGTAVGNLVVAIAPGSFTGSFQALQGPDAGKFQIVGSSLKTAAVNPPGAYNVTVCAQQADSINGQVCVPLAITATPPILSGVALSSGSFACGNAGTVGAVTVQGSGNFGSATLSLTGADAAQFSLSAATVPSNLTVGAAPQGCPRSYNVNLVAALTGATGSPFTSPQTVTGTSGPATISALSLSGLNFTGGATDGTASGMVSVTTSDGSTPTLTVINDTGGATGAGSDANSFRIGAGTYPNFPLLTNTAAGATDQPGQYHICATATGSYTNSGLTACGTVQSIGPGGAGWVLAFSDEFNDAQGMLENLVKQPITSIVWDSGVGGEATVTPASASTITQANCGVGGNTIGACSVSIVGATNPGTGGSAAVNGTFMVISATDGNHTFKIYMPGAAAKYCGASPCTLGGTATLGTGPWKNAIAGSCAASPCSGLPYLACNNACTSGGDGWDPHNCFVDGSGNLVEMLRGTVGWVPPTGSNMVASGNPSASSCHLSPHANAASGNGNTYDLSVAAEAWIEYRFKLNALNENWHTTLWALGSSNIWNSCPTAVMGGEWDLAEQGGSGALIQQNAYTTTCGGSPSFDATSWPSAFHTVAVDYTGSTSTFYIDGSQNGGVSSNQTINPVSNLYPIIDVENGGNGSTTQLTVDYVRAYHHVASGACYTAVTAVGVIPHTGTCNPETQIAVTTTTANATASLANWQANTGFPTQWIWTGVFTAQPGPSTAACASYTIGGVTGCIEHYRGCTGATTIAACTAAGGSRIAVYQYLGQGTCASGNSQNADQNSQTNANAGCGLFGRNHWFRPYDDGDVVFVHPAQFSQFGTNGDGNTIYVGPNQFNAGTNYVAPNNISIIGLTESGSRPAIACGGGCTGTLNNFGKGVVFIDSSSNILLQNIDIDGTGVACGASCPYNGAVFVGGGTATGANVTGTNANGVTFRQMRVHDWEGGNGDGIFGGVNANCGTLWLDQLEMYHNGGFQSSFQHNVYVNFSTACSNFNLKVTSSWFHDTYAGYLIKSRAQNADIEGNYLNGGLPQGGAYTLPENANFQMANGGNLTFKNNILTKSHVSTNCSGVNCPNPAMFAWATEGYLCTNVGCTTGYAPSNNGINAPFVGNSIDMENNTWVAFSRLPDGTNIVEPWTSESTVNTNPPPTFTSGAAFPVSPFVCKNNVFVGLAKGTGNNMYDYRCDTSGPSLIAGFTDINNDFTLTSPLSTNTSTGVLGELEYSHQAIGGNTRVLPTIGAVD